MPNAQVLRLRKAQTTSGEFYGTPKEFWGFHLPGQPARPSSVAKAALRANADRFGLDNKLTGVELRRLIPSLGGWHAIFSQHHAGTRVHRAYLTVHMDRDRSIYLIKNRAVPLHMLPKGKVQQISSRSAREIALRELSRIKGALTVMGHEQVWFPLGKKLRLAHKVRVHRARPREEWIVYIDALTGKVLSRWDNLSSATGTATLFDPNPVVALRDWRLLLHKRRPVRRVPQDAYVQVRLREIAANGMLDGPHVTTHPTKNRLCRPDLDFRIRSHQAGFEEVMVYYHVDSAIRYLRSLGYAGARSIFREPLMVNARATRDDNSWYSPGERLLSFGTGEVDDAEDAETILHEFGHALQDAICPDFGQSAESAAMGEGFSDYFSASFFAERKRRPLLPTVMSWDGILFGASNNPRRPPCVRRLDSKKTYRQFNHRSNADEHANGEIWAATLWSIWKALGRETADRIIVESHFQLDGFTTYARGARAIIDADRNLNGGRNVKTLKRIFERRAIGPL